MYSALFVMIIKAAFGVLLNCQSDFAANNETLFVALTGVKQKQSSLLSRI